MKIPGKKIIAIAMLDVVITCIVSAACIHVFNQRNVQCNDNFSVTLYDTTKHAFLPEMTAFSYIIYDISEYEEFLVYRKGTGLEHINPNDLNVDGRYLLQCNGSYEGINYFTSWLEICPFGKNVVLLYSRPMIKCTVLDENMSIIAPGDVINDDSTFFIAMSIAGGSCVPYFHYLADEMDYPWFTFKSGGDGYWKVMADHCFTSSYINSSYIHAEVDTSLRGNILLQCLFKEFFGNRYITSIKFSYRDMIVNVLGEWTWEQDQR